MTAFLLTANAPGVALAHGFASKLRGARRLPSGTIHVPNVASSQGGVHESLPLLYEKLAGLWQSQGDGRDGSTEGLRAQWMADTSTSLQRGRKRAAENGKGPPTKGPRRRPPIGFLRKGGSNWRASPRCLGYPAE